MPIDVAIFNYNGKETLELTLRSVLASTNVNISRVYIVDDGSTDGSQCIAENYDQVTLVQLSENTRNLNLVRNAGLRAAQTDRVLLTDNDIEFRPDCLQKLDKVMSEADDIAAVTPILMYMDDMERVFLYKSGFHYIGASTASNRGQSINESDIDPSPSTTMSGGILLINKKILPSGFQFDEKIPFDWGCDGEFYYRMIFMGYKCLINPQAVAYHQVKQRNVERAEGHITNRWYLLLKYYSWKTLILLIPVLIIYEFLLFCFFVVKGIPHLFLKFHWKNVVRLRSTLKKRRQIQAHRMVEDRDILSGGDIYVAPHLIHDPLFRYPFALFNILLKNYWTVIKIFL